jgi:hypothetical protein
MKSSPPRPDCSIGRWSKAAWTASRIARLPIIGDFQLRNEDTPQSWSA